jgi:ABC-type uncharacterized transport system substrate-binding protein
MRMRNLGKRLGLGLALIAAASAFLLLSDWKQRRAPASALPRVAVMQYSSVEILDEGIRGMLDQLRDDGYVQDRNIRFERFNAENDMPTANAIARELTSGRYGYVFTVSTNCLQAVANFNREGRVKHVFGVVADPVAAKVGIDPNNPLHHPRNMAGIGSLMPVGELIETARTLNPRLRKLGLPWNQSQANSERYAGIAREACRRLGIELIEGSVDNTAAVGEVTSSLAMRGADAILVVGDLTVGLGIDALIASARNAKIPVLATMPATVEKGVLFAEGADYYQIGQQVGQLATRVLRGEDMDRMPILYLMPKQYAVNLTALAGLKDTWRIPPELVATARTVIDASGTHRKEAARGGTVAAVPERVYRMGLAYFAPDEGADLCMKGLFDGLRAAGFTEGKNLEIKRAHAQGEIGNIPSMLQNFEGQRLDLIVPMTTPCLAAACSMVKKTPVVFTYVYDPVAAGAGTSLRDHIPNVTGVGSFPPIAETIDLIQRTVSGVRAVGTLYNSSEANSRKVVSVAREMFRARGLRLEEVSITGTNEVYQAAQVLATRNIQALWVTGDNTALQAFAGIAKVAETSRLPLFINDPEFVEKGALAAVGIGWYQSGFAAGKMAGRVLRGENPRDIPMENLAVKKLVLNDAVARRLGIRFPAAVVREAAK